MEEEVRNVEFIHKKITITSFNIVHMMNAYSCCKTAQALMELLPAGCGEANVPTKFLLYFVELQRRQLGPIVFVNKVAFGALLQIVTKNVASHSRSQLSEPIHQKNLKREQSCM